MAVIQRIEPLEEIYEILFAVLDRSSRENPANCGIESNESEEALRLIPVSEGVSLIADDAIEGGVIL
jgi:hypothetical protein